MTYTAPTDDDLRAIGDTADYLRETITHLTEDAARLDLVRSRLSEPAPPPPPPEPALPAVGVVGASSWNRMPASQRTAALDLIAAAGITHFRFGCPWASIERRKGVYDFRLYVTLAREIVEAGLIPIAVVAYTPSFYRPAGGDMFSTPTREGVLAYGVFCRALFQALVPLGVFRYEVWNEPNHKGPPGMWPVSPGVYVDLLLEAHNAASDISRHIRLVAGAVCPAPDKLPNALGASGFTRACLDYEPELWQFCDEWSVHPYPGTTALLDGQFWQRHMPAIHDLVPAHVPISATECGWSTHDMSEDDQADYIVGAILDWPETGVFYLFNWQDWGTVPARDNRQGLCRLDGSLRPAYHAVKNLLTGE